MMVLVWVMGGKFLERARIVPAVFQLARWFLVLFRGKVESFGVLAKSCSRNGGAVERTLGKGRRGEIEP